jgi:hypothetical protein
MKERNIFDRAGTGMRKEKCLVIEISNNLMEFLSHSNEKIKILKC